MQIPSSNSEQGQRLLKYVAGFFMTVVLLTAGGVMSASPTQVFGCAAAAVADLKHGLQLYNLEDTQPIDRVGGSRPRPRSVRDPSRHLDRNEPPGE